ncbi:MAG TPA: ATP-binding cassette domain-containing protein, partial [Candidatus Dorea intestinavium]|nr:ATP-binding cassette domain-containing protein [Candidatus Dorea intestinavium]
FDFLEAPEDLKDSKVTYPIENEPTNVTFENVSFGYTKERTIINNFSATIKEGETVAIVGPTGAGKTTMVKLLMRFYDINSGKIILGNRDITQYKKDDLRSEFGMVLQETWLFKGTIEDNIKYGKLDATHEEVVAAAKAAHAHRFIKTLPGGYNMELNEEASNVSQGQKQLLTIARAILANPRILILDEATSSVDTRTEIRIKKGMENLTKGKTSFIIAHRLSTIRDADMILVMDHGDVIEQGTHEELLAKQGFYADLYNSQFDRTA